MCRLPTAVYGFAAASLLALYTILFWLVQQGVRDHQQTTIPSIAFAAALATGLVVIGIAIGEGLAARKNS